MRNGNFVRLKYEWNLLIRSYPTYEEWKLFLAISQSSTHFRSYPTYEELKLANLIPLSKALRVLILPMRNGNIIREIT